MRFLFKVDATDSDVGDGRKDKVGMKGAGHWDVCPHWNGEGSKREGLGGGRSNRVHYYTTIPISFKFLLQIYHTSLEEEKQSSNKQKPRPSNT